MKLFFWHADKHQTILQVDGHRPAQITQNNKFTKSLQYFKHEVTNEVHSLCK